MILSFFWGIVVLNLCVAYLLGGGVHYYGIYRHIICMIVEGLI